MEQSSKGSKGFSIVPGPLWSFRPITVLLILSVLIAVARLYTYHEPLENDITTYAVIGHELLSGHSIYSDLWDHKPPAIHATYALAEMIAGYGPSAVYLLTVFTSVVSLFGIYVAGTAVGGTSGGLWAAVFWTTISGDLSLQANQPNTEVFLNACLSWCFAMLVRTTKSHLSRPQLIITGLLFALASVYKHLSIVVPAMLGLAYIIFPPLESPNRKKVCAQILIMGVIGMIVWGIVGFYFFAKGNFKSFYEAVFAFNRTYTGHITENLIQSFRPILLFPKAMQTVVPLVCLVILGLGIGLLKRIRPFILLLVFCLATQIEIALPGYFYSHYYQLWLPPLVIGAGWTVSLLSKLSTRFSPSFSHLVGGVLLGILLMLELPQYTLHPSLWPRVKYGHTDFLTTSLLGQEVNDLLKPNETFYVWGNDTGLYFSSHKHPPTGLFYALPLFNSVMGQELSRRVLSDLERTQPELLLVSKRFMTKHEGPHPVWNWLMERYRSIPSIPGRSNQGAFVFFVRRDGPLQARLYPHREPKKNP